MELILNQGQSGLRQDLLIYGKEYKLWRDGQFIGTATYSDDKFNGDCFLKKIVIDGDEGYMVYEADEWEMIK